MEREFFSRDEIKSLITSLINFLKHPIREITQVPDWQWLELIFVHVLVTAVTGVLTGLVSRSFGGILFGLFLSPIVTMITIAVLSLILYHFFQIVAGQSLPFRRLCTVVFFSCLPFFLFQILSGLVAAVSLLGFAFTGLILVVGLVENFRLPKKLVIRTVLAIYAVVFIAWLWGRLEHMDLDRNWNRDRTEAPAVELGK